MTAGRRPRVALVAHDVHERGGMERTFAELIRSLHRTIDFVVISNTLDPDLRGLVHWRRVAVSRKPFASATPAPAGCATGGPSGQPAAGRLEAEFS